METAAQGAVAGVATQVALSASPGAVAGQDPGNGNGNGTKTVHDSVLSEAAIPADMIWEDRPALKTTGGNGQWTSFAGEPNKERGKLAEVTDEKPKRIVITLDAAGDKLLLRRVYDVLISHPGDDHFTLMVTEADGRQYALDFYNESSTHYCEELVQRLLKFIPPGAIEVHTL